MYVPELTVIYLNSQNDCRWCDISWGHSKQQTLINIGSTIILWWSFFIPSAVSLDKEPVIKSPPLLGVNGWIQIGIHSGTAGGDAGSEVSHYGKGGQEKKKKTVFTGNMVSQFLIFFTMNAFCFSYHENII